MNTELLQPKVREAIREIDDALSRGDFAITREGYPTNDDLHSILEQLHRIEGELVGAQVPLKADRKLWIGRIITDGWWQYQEPLAKKLLFISEAYLRKLP